MTKGRGKRCTAKSKRTGKRCKANAMAGFDVCYYHGAMAALANIDNQYSVTHGKYSKALKLRCDNCFAADICKKFKAGAICSYEKDQTKPSLKERDQIIEFYEELIYKNVISLERGKRLESFQGGVIDADTTKMSATISRQVGQLVRILGLEATAPLVAVGIDAREQTLMISAEREHELMKEWVEHIKAFLCDECRKALEKA